MPSGAITTPTPLLSAAGSGLCTPRRRLHLRDQRRSSLPGRQRAQYQIADTDGAIALKAATGQIYYAAASLSNYRELYRFYLSAERAYFEYIAVDDGTQSDGQIEPSTRPLNPDARLYRDFRYGKNLHLVRTDYRSFRPDHLIPEDAFPGTLVVERAPLSALLAAQGVDYELAKDRFAAYIDLDAPQGAEHAELYAIYRPVLTAALTQAYIEACLQAADAATKAAARRQGCKPDVTVVNQLISSYNASANANVPQISDVTGLDHGVSFRLLGKTGLFSSRGLRYFVVQQTFDLYAAYKTILVGDVDAENAYEITQFEWLRSTLKASDARWKVVVNTTSLTNMVLDLTGEAPKLPQAILDVLDRLAVELRNRFYLFANIGGVTLLTGDIHVSFAAKHAGDVWEFTGPAVSSSTFRGEVDNIVRSDPILSQIPGVADLVAQLDPFLPLGNAEIRYTNTAANGFMALELSGERIEATYWQVDGAEATTSYYEKPARLLSKVNPKWIVVQR